MTKTQKIPEIQIIKRKFNLDKLEQNDEYYQKVYYDIKRQIDDHPDILFIDLIPNRNIENMAELGIILDLQEEFTDQIIIPRNELRKKFDLEEYDKYFGPLRFFQQS